MGLGMKILILWGFTEKSDFRGFTKSQYIEGELPKKRGHGQFSDLRGEEGGLGDKEVVVLLMGLILQCTLCIKSFWQVYQYCTHKAFII